MICRICRHAEGNTAPCPPAVMFGANVPLSSKIASLPLEIPLPQIVHAVVLAQEAVSLRPQIPLRWTVVIEREARPPSCGMAVGEGEVRQPQVPVTLRAGGAGGRAAVAPAVPGGTHELVGPAGIFPISESRGR